MKQITKLTFIMAVLLLSLVGCASDSSNKTIAEDKEIATVATITENSSDSELTDVKGEEPTEEEMTAEAIAVEEELPTAYNIILNNVYDALQLNPVTDEIKSVHFSIGIQEAVASGNTPEDRMKAIAYCMMDVNKDGVEIDIFY